MSRTLGLKGEQQAKDYLIKNGLRFIMSNYHCRMGEIDLIMQDKNHIVFIEVRARTSMQFGSAGESITYHKQQKIFKAAAHYLCKYQLYNQHPARFDVLTLQGQMKHIEWIKNAFSP